MAKADRKGYCLSALLLLCAISSSPQHARAQTGSTQAGLSVHWEELTGSDFIAAIKRAQGTCVLPFGILEKHGPHLPLGTDLLDVRYASLHAAEKDLPATEAAPNIPTGV